MSKKAKPKFTPKSGNPAKRALEEAAFKKAEEQKIRDTRYAREYANAKKDTVPQNVGSLYQPPIDLEPIPNVIMPPPRRKKKDGMRTKADKKKLFQKIGTGIIVGGAGLALIGSTFAPLLEANSIKEANEQAQIANESEALLDGNGNRVLVDRNGNPIDGTPRSDYETPKDGLETVDFGTETEVPISILPEDAKTGKADKDGATK